MNKRLEHYEKLSREQLTTMLINNVDDKNNLEKTNKYLDKQLDLYKSVINKIDGLIKDYLITEEYCGYVGIETTKFIEQLIQEIYEVKEK